MDVSSIIDHTKLNPDTTEIEIKKLCDEAFTNKFATICIMPYYIPFAYDYINNKYGEGKVKICSVIGFPNGAHQTIIKIAEANKAMLDGALELDMVMNLSALKSKKIKTVQADLTAISNTVHTKNCILKVIIETFLLSDDEKKLACELDNLSGSDFIKTSTGFNGGGATVNDIELIKKYSKPEMKIKASGGIYTYEMAKKLIEAGATRIGTSKSIEIIKNQNYINGS
ncbi:MAG: deoxyribose-phosphate aldolase [Candidatus Kapaibacterium sp.]